MSKTIEDKKAPSPDDDLPYVTACRKGDTEAFSVLVKRHSKKMLNIVYRMLGDYDEACDVTQETFLAAFRSLGRFKGEAKFSTWLYRIGINYSKNRLKQRQSLGRHESALPGGTADGEGGDAVYLAASDTSNPGDLLERRELEEQVQKGISALDEEYREIIVLRDIQGFSYDEIRSILQIPDGTVKSRLSRARADLKDYLEKVMGDL